MLCNVMHSGGNRVLCPQSLCSLLGSVVNETWLMVACPKYTIQCHYHSNIVCMGKA